jgi:hypothetical protein
MKRIHRPIFILSLLFIVITCVSCSEDDTPVNRAPEDSFLGINEKIAFETRGELIFRFLNSTTNPFEQFNIVNEPVQCFINYKNFAEAPFWYEDFELLENSASTLRIRYTDIQDANNTSVVTMEFTIVGDGVINLRWNDSESDEDNWGLSRTALAYTDYEHDCN